MKAVSVRQLKSNASAALRDAREQPVMVLNRHQPEALLIHLRDDSLLAEPGVRLALATALYKDESLSLGRAAKFAGQRLVHFIEHVSQLGIPVARGANTIREDMETLDEWYGRSHPTSTHSVDSGHHRQPAQFANATLSGSLR